MKKVILFILLTTSVFAQAPVGTQKFNGVYGNPFTTCIKKAIATTGANTTTTAMKIGSMYTVSCLDATLFTNVACKCLAGGSSVTANSVDAFWFNQPVAMTVFSGFQYLGCQSQTGTPNIYACPLNTQ